MRDRLRKFGMLKSRRTFKCLLTSDSADSLFFTPPSLIAERWAILLARQLTTFTYSSQRQDFGGGLQTQSLAFVVVVSKLKADAEKHEAAAKKYEAETIEAETQAYELRLQQAGRIE